MNTILTITILIAGEWYGLILPYPSMGICTAAATRMIEGFERRTDLELLTINCKSRKDA